MGIQNRKKACPTLTHLETITELGSFKLKRRRAGCAVQNSLVQLTHECEVKASLFPGHRCFQFWKRKPVPTDAGPPVFASD